MELIFHISRAFYPQVGQLHIVEVTRHLAYAGYPINVICTGRDGEKHIDLVENVNIYRCFISKGGIFNSISFYIQVINIIKAVFKKNYVSNAIAHVYFSPSTAFLPIFAKFDRFLNRRIKWFLDIRSGPIKPGIASSLKFKLIYNLCYGLYDGIFFIDTLLRDRFGKKKKPEIILPLGSNFSSFKPNKVERKKIRARLGISDQEFVLVYIGELSKSRRLEVLIDAFRLFLSKNNKVNVKLLLVGDGDDKDNLLNYVHRYGLTDKVLFTGYIPYEQIPSILNASDVGIAFIPITRYYNAQPPRKTVDYLASGLPVIATETEGNRRFVKNCLNGFLVKDCPESVASGIIKLLDPQQYEVLKKHARESVIQYDYENIVNSILIPAYKRVVNDY